ncbi:MAG: FdhF/YdeP family oxidoreductase [Armatimonadetes bacterium]|nr:FdhF/YdeP family oxidoreductase [Armatimonadota bacterium]
MDTQSTPNDNHYQPKTNFEPLEKAQADGEAQNSRALTSEEFTGLELSHPKTRAAGLMAVAKSMEHIARESGLVRGNKILLQLNQKGGFDCPGCAWPDPDDHRSKFEYCENGAKAVAEETTLARVSPEFFGAHSVEEMSRWSDMKIGKSGRLTHPMLLERGSTHYKAVSWDDAFSILAQELNGLGSPDEAIFYTSGRTSNEAAFLYQLFVRKFGTNNLPDCSNMCHESSGCAMTETLGVGKGTVTLEDFNKADCIFIFGQNPGTNHPRMLSALQKARGNGAEIVSVNPLPEAGLLGFAHPQNPRDLLTGGTPLSTLFLPVKINGDVAFLKAMMALMLESQDEFDHEFIAQHTHGYDEFIADLRSENLDNLIEKCGLSRQEIEKAAAIALKSKRMICCWAMGMTQHKNAVAGIQSIINLLLLGGHIGREGAGACPVRGHSNVQGDRTMGIWERPKPEFLDALRDEFGFEPPRAHGLDVVESIKAMHEGRAKVFLAMGGNFLSATPDTQFTAEAMRRCNLTAHVSTKLHRGHLVTGKRALILPCLGRTETDVQESGAQFVSVENSMGVVHTSQGRLEPASEHLKSEPAIVAGLAHAVLGQKSGLDWPRLAANYDEIRARIEKTIGGFENYNERVRRPEGFYLPNTAKDRVWKTATGKANFTVHAAPKHELEADQLLMMTIRSHDQYNTTIYGLDDRSRGVKNERRVVFLNAQDMKSRDLKIGDLVHLTSHFEGEERRAPHFIAIEYPIPLGCAATYFPETNVLVPIRSVAEKSNTPASKSVVIRVHKAV